MKPIAILLGLSLFTSTTSYACEPQFSSHYTDLSKNCQWKFQEKDLEEGQDNDLICTGYGGYQLLIMFNAEDTLLSVVQADDQGPRYALNIPDYQKGMIEWRMADDLPFAIIARSRSYDANSKAVNSLEIRGLGEFAELNTSVDTRMKNANEIARSRADKGYLKQSKKRCEPVQPAN